MGLGAFVSRTHWMEPVKAKLSLKPIITKAEISRTGATRLMKLRTSPPTTNCTSWRTLCPA